jgi:hypothetical protein
MSTRFRLVMVLSGFLVLGACVAPTDPGMPTEDEHDEPGDPGRGQSFNASSSPVFFA